jgi:hypothetical protein
VLLIRAGAKLDPDWQEQEALEAAAQRVRSDPRMLAALHSAD